MADLHSFERYETRTQNHLDLQEIQALREKIKELCELLAQAQEAIRVYEDYLKIPPPPIYLEKSFGDL